MADTRFDALSQSLRAGPSRRGLTRLLGGLALGAPLALLGRREAAAGRRRCPSLSCAQSCPGACKFCFIRPHVPKMCGDEGGISTCAGSICASDADCSSTAFPFCVSRVVDRATGQAQDVCTGQPGAYCTSIPAC